MAQMRNGNSDTAKLTEWIGRKCRNHSPLKELKAKPKKQTAAEEAKALLTDQKPGFAAKAQKGRAYVVNEEKVRRSRVKDGNVLLYQDKGRTFRITVEEIDDEQLETDESELSLQPVQY